MHRGLLGQVPCYGGGLFLVIAAFCSCDRSAATVSTSIDPQPVVVTLSPVSPPLQHQREPLLPDAGITTGLDDWFSGDSSISSSFDLLEPPLLLSHRRRLSCSMSGRVSAGLDIITGRPSSPLASLQRIEWIHCYVKLSKPVRLPLATSGIHRRFLLAWNRRE